MCAGDYLSEEVMESAMKAGPGSYYDLGTGKVLGFLHTALTFILPTIGVIILVGCSVHGYKMHKAK